MLHQYTMLNPDFEAAASCSQIAKVAASSILIADDSEAYRELYSDLLESEGFRTLCAKDGNEALELLKGQPVDLALIDVMMPNRDGLAVCRELKSNPETRLIPLLLLTGADTVQSRISGIESGADQYMTKPVATSELLARVRALIEKKRFTDHLENTERVLISFSNIVEAKNPYTAGHGNRVSRLAAALAARLGLSPDEQSLVRQGGMMHDIGKVGVPDSILLKSGPLTTDEKAILNSHAIFGARICAPLPSFRPLLQIIRNHHERLDGSGYPDALCGSQLDPKTRIVSIADVYDALTTNRPYRGEMSVSEALAQIRREVDQGWWDTHIFKEFERLIVQIY